MPKRRKASKPPARVDKSPALADWERDPLIAHIKRVGTPEQYALLRLHMTAIHAPCILCDFWPAEHPAWFSTPKAEAWGGKSGTWRTILYHICTRCTTLPNVAFRVEARLQARIAGARN